MAGFLNEVAAELYARYGEELSSMELLFPSRRAASSLPTPSRRLSTDRSGSRAGRRSTS